MIQTFVDIFINNKDQLRERLKKAHPENYGEIVKLLISLFKEKIDDNCFLRNNIPDPEKIHIIDDGDYQGTLLFIIGSTDYQPSVYWSMMVDYGSCSGCDTFVSIRDNDVGPAPSEQQIEDYLTLMLHLAQSMQQITGDET